MNADALTLLAAKLSVPITHLWAVLVAQARIEVITNIVYMVLFLLSLYPIWLLGEKYCYVAWDYDNHRRERLRCFLNETVVFWVILVGVYLFAGITFTIVNGHNLVAYWFNPDFYALQYILKAAK